MAIRLDSDDRGEHYDFCEHRPATLSGYVYEDRNNDGTRQPEELPLADVILELLDEDDQVVATTTTDAQGHYVFEGLRLGRYAVRQVQPVGYLDGLDGAGTVGGQRRGVASNPGDRISQIQLGWGEVGVDFNFGELLPASLSGMVHSSPLEDCWNDEHALALAGVTLQLFTADGRLVADTVTNDQGAYQFDHLRPGAYRIVEQQPRGHFDGGQRAGSQGGDATWPNQIREIQLSSGDRAAHSDFCEVPPSSVSGFVFVDGAPILLAPGDTLPRDISSLRDGTLTSDDRRLAGVQLELRGGIRGEPIYGDVALAGRDAAGRADSHHHRPIGLLRVFRAAQRQLQRLPDSPRGLHRRHRHAGHDEWGGH